MDTLVAFPTAFPTAFPPFHAGIFNTSTIKNIKSKKRSESIKEKKEKKENEIYNKHNKNNKNKKQKNYTKYRNTIVLKKRILKLNIRHDHFCYIPEAPEGIQMRIHTFGSSIQQMYNTLLSHKKVYMCQKKTSFTKRLGIRNVWEHDYKNLKKWYFIYKRRRFLFQVLVLKYLVSLSKRSIKNTEDPCTLVNPVQKVVCMDLNRRCSYQFIRQK